MNHEGGEGGRLIKCWSWEKVHSSPSYKLRFVWSSSELTDTSDSIE